MIPEGGMCNPDFSDTRSQLLEPERRMDCPRAAMRETPAAISTTLLWRKQEDRSHLVDRTGNC